MSLLTTSAFLLLLSYASLISTNPSATVDVDRSNLCHDLGHSCQHTKDCCDDSICSLVEENKLCVSWNHLWKRSADNFVIPPYYNPKNYLYPYGIHIAPFPFYQAYEERYSKTHQRNKMEWDTCRFHEDCGEGNCCYGHFRFRSLPKSFCRPNRNPQSELCEPLTKYRSLKDVPAWKQQRQSQAERQQAGGAAMAAAIGRPTMFA